MIDEREVGDLLRAATDGIAVPVAPTRELVAAGNRRRRRRWVVASLATAAAVASVAVAVPVALSSEESGRTVPSASPTTGPGAACVDQVPSRVLPGWARAGFSDARPRMPYVLGDKGDIAAILFARPLTSPRPVGHSNKILWVSRVPDPSSLRITATLQGGSNTVTRVVDGGPGPSIIDLPKPGCWHLTLRWGHHSDTLDLAYSAR